jgi:hypothetical protein
MSKNVLKNDTFGEKVWNISDLYSIGKETVIRTDKKRSMEL